MLCTPLWYAFQLGLYYTELSNNSNRGPDEVYTTKEEGLD